MNCIYYKPKSGSLHGGGNSFSCVFCKNCMLCLCTSVYMGVKGSWLHIDDFQYLVNLDVIGVD